MTSADVAREAGLSRTTVSYVLNDTPHQKIPAETRRRVLEAAARLEYSPSAAARALRSGRSDVVLCLLPDWPLGPAVGATLTGLSRVLARYGMTFVAHPTAAGDRSIAEIWKAITPAAVLAFEEFSADEVSAMRSAGVAVVLAMLGRGLDIPQQRVGRLQAEHLAARGHTRLGYAFPDDARLRSFAEPRLAGARTASVELGLAPPVVQVVPLAVAGAARAVRAWRGQVTGVCAYNDEVALAVLAGLRTLQLAAPDDLAVIGVDDIPAAALAAPPLTTVTTDHGVMAAYLAGSVMAAIAGTPGPSRPGPDIVQVIRRDSA